MTRRNRRNNRTSKRGEEIPPPSDRHSFWVPAHDDIDEHDMVYEGGPMRLATPSPQRSNRTAETSDQAHSARNEVEENSASARSADNEEESAVTSSTAETSATTSDAQSTSLSTTAPPHDGYDSDELSEPTPRRTPGRSEDVAEPTGNETEETSDPARTAGNEEEVAVYTMPEARTLSELRAQIHRMHVELQRARHTLPGVPALHRIWSDEWKTAPDTHHLWQLFLALQPVVATRQAEDLQRLYGDNTITQSSSSTSVTDASAPVPNESMDTDAAPATSAEATAAESPLDVSDTPSDLDYRTDKTRSPQYEPIPSPVHPSHPPPPPRPTDPRRPSTVEEDVDELTTDFRLPPTKPATQQQFWNPSPPPVGPTRSVGHTGEVTVEETRSVPDTRKAPKIQKAQLAATVATTNATKPKGSGNQQRTSVRTVKKSGQTSASSDGHQSRSSTGSKRSRVSDGRSYPPPTKRTGSRSPNRKPSRSLERHVQRKKNSQHRLMVPVIDGCVYKDMAIDTAKTNHQPSAWQTEFDLPHNPYELLGVINHFCVPSTNLPPTAVTRHAENPLTPYVDHTFEQALLEDTIVPWKFILGSTIACAPTYWRFTGTKAREYLYKAFDRNNLYRSKVNACGIGPTGFDLRSGGYLVTGKYAGQRENIIRYGRIARNVRMPLVIHVEYDYLPEGVTNLHDEAIKALRHDAELSSRHRIHLVAFKATALDLIHWLEEFPRTVISMDLDFLQGVLEASRVNTNDEHYRHASALKKFLIHVPLDNLGLHSGCPKNHTVPGTYKTPSMLLRATRKFEELTGTPGDRLLEFNAANLVDMYDLNPDLLDRSTNTKDLRDPAIGPPTVPYLVPTSSEMRSC